MRYMSHNKILSDNNKILSHNNKTQDTKRGEAGGWRQVVTLFAVQSKINTKTDDIT